MKLRRVLLPLVVLPVLGLLLVPMLLGLSPTSLGSLFSVATGLGAKLACSGHFITGLPPGQVLEDLASYSPAYGFVNIEYDEASRSSHASLLGLASRSAHYRPGIGCTLDLGDVSALDAVVAPVLEESAAAWPRGETVTTVDPSMQQRLDTMLIEDNAEGYVTRALLLVRDGHVVAESYAAGFDAATPHLGWSMGKSLTAQLLGTLEYRGQLDVTESALFPEWSGDERETISIEALLHMASGLYFEEVYAPGSNATQMLFNTHSASTVALQQPLEYPVGKHFSYSSGTTNLLSRLFYERVGGSTQHAVDYLYSEFFQPLGMRNTVLEPDPSGVFVGSSYIYASARDWARLGELMLRGGVLNGQRLLGENWVERAATPNGAENDARYGYQFWLNAGGDQLRWPDLPADAYAMQGNRSQVVMIIPSRNTVVVRLGWSATSYPTSRKLALLLD
jgi:CubicO group peptidase (beta-lactamase class C family)